MKKLSQVTKEDAIDILCADPRISGFFLTGKWHLEDRTKDIGEDCKFLSARSKAFQMWFFDDVINMEENDHPEKVTDLFDNQNVNYRCYLKAHDLGYYVPELSDKLGRSKDLAIWALKQTI